MRRIERCERLKWSAITSSRSGRAFFTILLACAYGSSAWAVPWDGGGDGVSWTDGNNWNPNAVPSGVTADINLNGAAVTLGSSPPAITGLNLSTSANVTTSLTVSGAGQTLDLSGGALNMATGNAASIATLSLTNTTINNVSAAQIARRGGTATLTLNNSTINGTGLSDNFFFAFFGEGADTANLTLTNNSRLNLTNRSIFAGGTNNNEKLNLSIDGTSQINVTAGSLNFGGGNTSFAGDVDTPAGTMVYNLPMAAAANTNGKIFARDGVNVATQNNSKVEVNLNSGGATPSDATLNWNGASLNVATGTGSTGLLNLTGMTLNNVSAATIARRGSAGTLNMVNSTINGTGASDNFFLAFFGEGQDTATLNMTNSRINLANRAMFIGGTNNNEKAFITMDATSQININAGSLNFGGGNTSFAGDVDTPAGVMVYNLSMAAAANTNGKIFARDGVNVATQNNSKVEVNLNSGGATPSDATLNWNGASLNVATGTGSTGLLNLTGMTLNNVSAATIARRGSAGTLNMVNSTINGTGASDNFFLAFFGEGQDTATLNMTNSRINLANRAMFIGGTNNNEKAFITMDATSQINILNGGLHLAGGNTAFAGDVDTPAGVMVYELPFAAAANTNGKIYSHFGFQVAGQQNSKVELIVTDTGPNASSSSIDFHGDGLTIAQGGNGSLGRVLIDDVDITGVSYAYVGRRSNADGTLSIKDATLTSTGAADNFFIAFNESNPKGRVILDNGNIVLQNRALFNRHGASGAAEIIGHGSIDVQASQFFNDGRVVADGGLLSIAAAGGVASQNFATNQFAFGTSGWYAVNAGKLTLPGLTSIGAGKTWGEDPSDTTPDLVNSVRFQNVANAAGTLNGSLYASDHPDVPAGLVNPIGIWDFSDLTFDSAELLIRYDDALVASLSVAETDLDLWHFTGGMWVDITGSIDTVNKRITSDPIASLSFFAVAEDAINATVEQIPEPASVALWSILGVVGLAIGVRRLRKR